MTKRSSVAPIRSGRPAAHEVESRREHLISVATDLFLTEGYEATSLERIAQVARTSKATIYRNFGDKEDLFRLVFGSFGEGLWPRLSDVQTAGRSPQEVLLDFANLFMSPEVLNAGAIRLIRLVYREAPRFPELARIYAEGEAMSLAPVRSYLVEADRAKRLRVDDPTWAASHFAELIWGTWVKRLLMGLAELPNAAERRRVVESGVRVFLHGYAVRSGS